MPKKGRSQVSTLTVLLYFLCHTCSSTQLFCSYSFSSFACKHSFYSSHHYFLPFNTRHIDCHISHIWTPHSYLKTAKISRQFHYVVLTRPPGKSITRFSFFKAYIMVVIRSSLSYKPVTVLTMSWKAKLLSFLWRLWLWWIWWYNFL